MGQRSLRDAIVKIKDGGSNEITIKLGDGNISWSEKREVNYTHDRGLVDEARLGDDQPCDVKFDFVWQWLQSLSGTSVVEALKGTASGWVTAGGSCEPYSVDLIVEIYGCAGGSLMETLTFGDFRYTQLDYDLKQGMVACSGSTPAGGPVVT